MVRESDEEDVEDEDERERYKSVSRVKSMEKVSSDAAAGNMDLTKIKRKKFVNEKGNSGPNHRVTIDLISSTNVG